MSARYGKRDILKNINISFHTNELTGLIGPNGSGKSTLLKCIYRVLKPYAGEVFLDDQAVSGLSYKESAKKIAVLTQTHKIGLDFRVKDVVLMGRTPYKGIMEGDNAEDKEIADEAMAETGVKGMELLSFSSLSGGEQQRVMLARALAQKTPCLILDEPTNHLDITYQLQIMNMVSGRSLTVVAAIHDLNMAAMYCDRIIAIDQGKIVAEGTPEEVLIPETIEMLYHVKSMVCQRPDGRPAIIYERRLP